MKPSKHAMDSANFGVAVAQLAVKNGLNNIQVFSALFGYLYKQMRDSGLSHKEAAILFKWAVDRTESAYTEFEKVKNYEKHADAEPDEATTAEVERLLRGLGA